LEKIGTRVRNLGKDGLGGVLSLGTNILEQRKESLTTLKAFIQQMELDGVEKDRRLCVIGYNKQLSLRGVNVHPLLSGLQAPPKPWDLKT